MHCTYLYLLGRHLSWVVNDVAPGVRLLRLELLVGRWAQAPLRQREQHLGRGGH